MRNMFVFDLDGTIIIDNKMLDSILYETLKSLEKREEKIVFCYLKITERCEKSIAKALVKSSVNFCAMVRLQFLDNEVIAQASIPKEVYEKICYY